MELENIKQQIDELQLNTNLLTKDVAGVFPVIVETLSLVQETIKENQLTHENDSSDRKLLIACIKDVNAAVDRYVNDYGNLQGKADEIINRTEKLQRYLDKALESLKVEVKKIPGQVSIIHKHGIDLKSTKWVVVLSSLFVVSIVCLGFSLGLFVNQQTLRNDAWKLRMARLEQPERGCTKNCVMSVNHLDTISYGNTRRI